MTHRPQAEFWFDLHVRAYQHVNAKQLGVRHLRPAVGGGHPKFDVAIEKGLERANPS
jgi:hypothetical protein